MDETCVAQETSQLDIPPWDLGWGCNSEFDSWVAEGDLSTYFDGVEEIEVTDTKPTRHDDDELLVHVHECNQEKSKNSTGGLRRTRTVQESGQVAKTDNKRKANSRHLENVRKRRALEETVSEIIKDAETALIQKAAVARTCSKTTEELDDAVTARQALTREADKKTMGLGITNKRKASAEPHCELKEGITTKRRALARPHCERETKDSDKVPTRRNLVKPGCKITYPDCLSPRQVLAKPSRKMTDSDFLPKRRKLVKPGCKITNPDCVAPRQVLAKPGCKMTDSDSLHKRRNLVKPGCKITNLDCVAPRQDLAKPGCKMMASDSLPKRQDCLAKPVCKTTNSGDASRLKATTGPSCRMNTVPKRAAAKVPNLEEMKHKLQDSYSNATKRRTTQLLDFKVLPKPTQGSCQRIAKRTTMNRSILKKTALF